MRNSLQQQGWQCVLGGNVTIDMVIAVKLVVVTDYNNAPPGVLTLPGFGHAEYIHIGRPPGKLDGFLNRHFVKRDEVLSLAQGELDFVRFVNVLLQSCSTNTRIMLRLLQMYYVVSLPVFSLF